MDFSSPSNLYRFKEAFFHRFSGKVISKMIDRCTSGRFGLYRRFDFFSLQIFFARFPSQVLLFLPKILISTVFFPFPSPMSVENPRRPSMIFSGSVVACLFSFAFFFLPSVQSRIYGCPFSELCRRIRGPQCLPLFYFWIPDFDAPRT